MKDKLQTFDWAGTLLNAATFTLFITVLTFSGAKFSWASSTVIAMWTVFGACLVAFVLQQAFAFLTTPERRIFPVHFIRNKDYVLLYVITSCAAAVNAVTIYYVPLFFAFTRGDGPLQAAVRLLPYIVVFITMVLIAGGSLPFTGRYSIYYIVGGVFITAGLAAMFTIQADTSSAQVYAYEAIIAVGAGLTFQNAYAVMAAKVDTSDRGNAIGFINVSQIGTTALALAIAGALFQDLGFTFLSEKLAAFNPTVNLLHAALGGTASQQLSSAPSQTIVLAVETIGYTIARIFGTCIAAGVLLLVASLLLSHKKLDLDDQRPGFA